MALTKITKAMMADESIDSDNYVDGSIDNAHIADDAIDSEHYADGSIDEAHIADDAVTADKLANSINTAIAANTAKVTNATHSGDVTGATTLTIATDAVDIAMLSATGTANSSTFLRGDNAWAAAGGGKVQQIVYNKYYNDNNSSATMPWDGTIPQITEGWEPDDMDVTITPTSASSILRIDIQLAGSKSSSNPEVLIVALFQDSTANALAATAVGGTGTHYGVGPIHFLTISHPMVAGTTSATTFKTRMGASSGTSYIGRGHDGSTLGGPLCSSIIVTEYSP